MASNKALLPLELILRANKNYAEMKIILREECSGHVKRIDATLRRVNFLLYCVISSAPRATVRKVSFLR